jgi:hypothetical protein
LPRPTVIAEPASKARRGCVVSFNRNKLLKA